MGGVVAGALQGDAANRTDVHVGRPDPRGAGENELRFGFDPAGAGQPGSVATAAAHSPKANRAARVPPEIIEAILGVARRDAAGGLEEMEDLIGPP